MLGRANSGRCLRHRVGDDTTRSQQFTYDQVNRLTSGETTSTYSTSPSHCWGEAYVYDNQSSGSGEYGNLTNINVVSNSYNGCTQESLSISSGTANQIASFSYDQVGNTLNDTHNTYAYNAESEIKSGGGVNYTYDGDGNRVEKNTIKIYWYGAGATILDESDTSGNITDEFVFLGGKRIAHRYASGVINYYAEDMLGTNRVILPSAAGSPCYDADFYPFGGERAYTSTCAENYKFEGKKRDQETGNDDFGARYYTSSFGRWESPDWSSIPAPVPYANLTNPQTLNLYIMASDDPETFADLDGHCGQQDGGGCPHVEVKADSDPQVMMNVKLDDKTTRSGVGSMMTITVTDGQGKPIPGAVVKENPTTRDNFENSAQAQTANSKTVATDQNGTIRDVVMQPVTDKHMDDDQASMIGQISSNYAVDKTITQQLTITTTGSSGQTCTCQATYQESLKNVDASGHLNPINVATSNNFAPIKPTTPVVTSVVKKDPQNP